MGKTDMNKKIRKIASVKDTIGRLGNVLVMVITTINTITLAVINYMDGQHWEAGVYLGLLVLLHIPAIIILSLGVILVTVRRTRNFVYARRKKVVRDAETGGRGISSTDTVQELVFVERGLSSTSSVDNVQELILVNETDVETETECEIIFSEKSLEPSKDQEGVAEESKDTENCSEGKPGVACESHDKTGKENNLEGNAHEGRDTEAGWLSLQKEEEKMICSESKGSLNPPVDKTDLGQYLLENAVQKETASKGAEGHALLLETETGATIIDFDNADNSNNV